MSTPRADPPTADVKLEKNLQGLKSSKLRKLREGARTTSQYAVKTERLRRNASYPWPVPFRKCRASAGTASTPQVEKAPGSDPGSSHNVALVRFNTKPDSEKADTAAPSTAMRKDCLPLNTCVHIDADLQTRSETDRGEDPWDARTEGPRTELDLDPELRRVLENDAGQGEQQDADSNAAHSRDLSAENNSADVDHLEVDDSTRYPDSVLETHAATADGAPSYFGGGPACWDWQPYKPYNGWDWSWSYGDEVPNSLPMPSGTSAATAHTLDDVPFDNLPIKHGVRMVPLRKEQIRYIYKEDGTW